MRSRSSMGPTGECGSATIWVLCAVLVLCLVTGVGLSVGAVAATTARARTAADLSALAAAAALVRDEGAPCMRAAAIAQANQVVLTRCQLDGRDVRVWIAAPLPPMLRPIAGGWATARARAGPVERGDRPVRPR
jgi:secretion/DNA translocation related TadE-like protein